MAFSVYPIDILEVNDNYVWVITPQDSTQAYVVDPGAADPVFSWLEQQGRTLAGIIITHRHWDHVNGIDDLLSKHRVPIWGPQSAAIPQVTERLDDGDTVELDGLALSVMSVPGHTPEHVAYYSTDNPTPALFCGDTLFAAGCGKLLDGTAEQLHTSLLRLAQLPSNTQIYCAHEYTLANLAFAEAVEPRNRKIHDRRRQVEHWRSKGLPSLPSSMEEELATNPFLRCQVTEVAQSARDHTDLPLKEPLDVFTALRRWKDDFRANV